MTLLFLGFAVLVRMMHGRFSRVMGGVLSMPVRYVGVMASLFVIPGFVMLGSFTMMFRRVLVMFGRLVVVFCTFVFRHLWLSAFQD